MFHVVVIAIDRRLEDVVCLFVQSEVRIEIAPFEEEVGRRYAGGIRSIEEAVKSVDESSYIEGYPFVLIIAFWRFILVVVIVVFVACHPHLV